MTESTFGQIVEPALIRLSLPVDASSLERLVFSPRSPYYVCALHRDKSPELFDMRQSQVPDAVRLPGHFPEHITGMEPCRAAVRFASPAVDAAFATSEEGRLSELALVFGEGDTMVHRFALPSMKPLSPVQIEEPCSVSYGTWGKSMAVGTHDGTLAIVDVLETPYIANSLRGTSGAVVKCALSYRDGVYGFTSSSPIFGFGRRSLNASSYHPKDMNGAAVGDGDWRYIACDPESSLIFLADGGGTFWLIRSESFDGGIGQLEIGSRIRTVDFIAGNQILVVSDIGFELWHYERQNDGSVGRCSRVMIGVSDGEREEFLGAAKYGDSLIIAVADDCIL